MNETSFFPRGSGLTLAELAGLCEADIAGPFDADARFTGVATLGTARPDDVAFFDNPRYAAELAETRAGCVIVGPKQRRLVPERLPLLLATDPQRALALAGRALFPGAMTPTTMAPQSGVSGRAVVDPSARLEDDVVVEALAFVGPGAEIGRGTIVSVGSVVGPGCRIGRDCRIGPNVTLQHTLIGDRVILHPGVRIGQDGFGYAVGAKGILKSVQIGRVVVQDGVEIGANTTIDRGALRDTVIGENTKVDNQVQIAHNVTIGRNCIIVSQVGISGSVTIGSGVGVGGQTGFNGHVTIGDGAQIAAVSTVIGDVPAGSRWGGMPARDVRDWFREMTWLRESAKAGRKPKRSEKGDE